jgi:hypothetical protein
MGAKGGNKIEHDVERKRTREKDVNKNVNKNNGGTQFDWAGRIRGSRPKIPKYVLVKNAYRKNA